MWQAAREKAHCELEMEHPNSVSHCLWPSLISSALQNIQDILLGNTMILFSLFLFSHFSIKNAQLVLCLSVLFAFLCSSWIFQSYRTSGSRELAGLTATKGRTRVSHTDQWSAQARGSLSPPPRASSGSLCPFSTLQTTSHFARALKVLEWQLTMSGGKSQNEKCRDPHPSQPLVCFWV